MGKLMHSHDDLTMTRELGTTRMLLSSPMSSSSTLLPL